MTTSQLIIAPARVLKACVCGIALALVGCATTPTPLTSSEVRGRVNADQFRIYSDQEPVFKAIGFNEAIARALKYNLDYRLKLMESALSMGLADVARFDMLPNLVASAGYATRNNDSGGTSFGIETGIVSLIPSTSAERNHRTSGVELSWNILDFGVGYFRAQQQADQVLISDERKRRVVQNILQDVRSAYWRAVGAQRLSRDAERLMVRVKTALERSREAEAQGLIPPKDALGYQRLLLDAVQLLSARRQELEFAKRELSALMNITPGTDFSVVEEEEKPLMASPVNVAELEELALINRPELREEDYRVRITGAEAKRQLLGLMPGLNVGINTQTDSNRYLYNDHWVDSSARVTFNMLKLLSLPAINRSQEAQVKNDEARRLALTMAILTQVRVALERYRQTQNDFDLARDSTQVDQRLAGYARAAQSSRADSELELIRAETRALNSEYQRYAAYAAAQTAYGRIFNSIGLDYVPEGLESASLTEIGASVASSLAQIEGETFVKLTLDVPTTPRFMLHFDGVSATVLPATRDSATLKMDTTLATAAPADSLNIDPAQQADILAGVEKALQRNRLLIGKDENIPVLGFKLLVESSSNGVRRAQWLLTMTAPNGKQLGQTRYTSTLSSEPTTRSLIAFAEAAAISNLRNISAWLQPVAK